MNVSTTNARLVADVDAQVTWLRVQKLVIPDRDKAIFYLRAMGWYRFNGYLTPFEKALPTGKVDFDSVLRLYRFDRRLRLHVLNALERIEVAFKNLISCHLFGSHGANWMTTTNWVNPKYSSSEDGLKHIEKISSDLKDLIKELRERSVTRKAAGFVAQGIKVDRARIPRDDYDPYEISEIMSFGSATRIFAALPRKTQVEMARNNYWPIYHNVLMDWLKRLTIVRNIAAHHGRLWNLEFSPNPFFPDPVQETLPQERSDHRLTNRFYGRCVMIFILLSRAARNTRWHQTLDTIFREEGEQAAIDIYAGMGFPRDWLSAPVWDPARWSNNGQGTLGTRPQEG